MSKNKDNPESSYMTAPSDTANGNGSENHKKKNTNESGKKKKS